MKKTEQRWMHISTGLLVERGRKPDNSANDYRTVTVTWDDPEWEDVEVVRWVVVNTSDKSECFTSHSEKMCEDCMKNVREPEKLEIVRLSNTYRRRKPEPEVENYCPSCGGYVRDVERKVEG